MRAIPMLGVVLALTVGWGGAALANKLDDAQSAFADMRDVEALALFGEVLADRASSPETLAAARFGRGELYALANQPDDAIADFTAALALPQAPAERAITYVSRAESLVRRNRIEEAILDYSQSYALQPNQAGVLTARGNLYSRLGKKEEALADFDAELKRRPTYYRALTGRAVVLNLPLPPNPEAGRR